MRWIAAALATVAVTGLLWGVGEMHRRNCITEGTAQSCSVLPWRPWHKDPAPKNVGNTPPPGVSLSEWQALLREHGVTP